MVSIYFYFFIIFCCVGTSRQKSCFEILMYFSLAVLDNEFWLLLLRLCYL